MEAPPLERKLVAILAADIQGYSRLMGIDEENTLATLSAHRAITDAIIAQHGGRICGTAGDSVLAEFASVFAAVQCAVEIQRDLAQANLTLGEERRMWFRIGINIGDVMVKDGDIFGDGVNIAARIEGLAKPGGICISRGVYDHVRRKLPYGFEDLGEQSVKNIAQPIRVFRLIPDVTTKQSTSGREAALVPSCWRHARSQGPRGRAVVLGVRARERQPGVAASLSGEIPGRRIQIARRNPHQRAPRAAHILIGPSVRYDAPAYAGRWRATINYDPKPFAWTADPEKIIAAVRRGYQVLDSIH
jgi:class 3 adenylate cyclase